MLDANESDACGQSQQEKGNGEKLAHIRSPNGWRISAAGGASEGGIRLLDADKGDPSGDGCRDEGDGEKFAH